MELKKFEVYQSWKNYSFTETELRELDAKKKEVQNMDDKLLPLIREYLKMNPNSVDSSDIIEEDEDDLIEVINWTLYDDDKMFIEIKDWENNNIGLVMSKKFVTDLFLFLKDQESYRNAKKYNL